MFTRVNFFSGNITGQCDIILNKLIIRSGFTNKCNGNWSYNMIQIITNAKFTVITKYDLGHL